MTASLYTCAACGGTFPSDQSEEPAVQEAKARYGMDPADGAMAKVCADCYEKITAFEDALLRAPKARWN